MEQFKQSFRQAVRRARKSGIQIEYEIKLEKDGKKQVLLSKDNAEDEMEEAQAEKEWRNA